MMNIRFGARFCMGGMGLPMGDTRKILTETAKAQGIEIETVHWQGETMSVYTGPDALGYREALASFQRGDHPPETDYMDPEKTVLWREYRNTRPKTMVVKDAATDFETTHANYTLISGRPKFDLLTLEPLPVAQPAPRSAEDYSI